LLPYFYDHVTVAVVLLGTTAIGFTMSGLPLVSMAVTAFMAAVAWWGPGEDDEDDEVIEAELYDEV
jgi:hypothetical protein